MFLHVISCPLCVVRSKVTSCAIRQCLVLTLCFRHFAIITMVFPLCTSTMAYINIPSYTKNTLKSKVTSILKKTYTHNWKIEIEEEKAHRKDRQKYKKKMVVYSFKKQWRRKNKTLESEYELMFTPIGGNSHKFKQSDSQIIRNGSTLIRQYCT